MSTDTRNDGGPAANVPMETLAAALKAWDDCPDYAFESTLLENAAGLAEAARAVLASRSSKEA